MPGSGSLCRMARANRNRNVDWQAADRLTGLLADHGWTAEDLARESLPTGHPERAVSPRTIYRVLNEGHKPTAPVQFEIAQAFGLLPSHIWASVPVLARNYLEAEAA